MGWKMPNVVVVAVAAILSLVTVETVLAAVVTADSQQDFDSGAGGGMKSLNIELIKSSILNKLGMQRPPEFDDQLPLQVFVSKHSSDRGSFAVESSQISYNVSDDDDDDDYHVKTQKIIAFAQPHPTMQILQGQYPLYFTFSEQTRHYRITKAILWVYKRRLDVAIDNSAVIIDVYKINPINLQQSLVSSTKQVLNSTEPGWVPIELQSSIFDWFKTIDEVKNLTLIVQAYYSNKNITHDKTPFITDARKRDDITESRVMQIPYLEVHTHHGPRVPKQAGGSEQAATEVQRYAYPVMQASGRLQ